MSKLFKIFERLAGERRGKVRHADIAIATFASLTALLLVGWISRTVAGDQAGLYLMASMGASAVLIFAVPGTQMARPWSFCCGHFLSAFVGVSCSLLIGDLVLASALAVSTSIFLMSYLRCMHPPGGAAAMIPIVSGESVSAMGYSFLLIPVGINVLVMLLVSLIYFRYMAYRNKKFMAQRSE